jgi:hypothetical protein
VANKTFWTPENRRRLDAMVRKGALLVSLERAAEILGTSFSTVRVEITRRGIAPSVSHAFEWTPRRKKMLRAMLDDEGQLILPRAAAAKIIGCDRSTLITGLVRLQGPTGPVDVARLRNLTTEEGHLKIPKHEAARQLGCSEKALRNAMRSVGVRAAPQFSWTPEKIALLADMTDADGHLTLTHADAAARIGCSVRALQKRLAVSSVRKMPHKPKAHAGPTPIARLARVMNAWLPRPAPRQVAAAVKCVPSLADITEEHLGHRLRALAAIYGVAEKEALQMALSAPGLFSADLPSLRRNLRDGATALGMKAKVHAQLVCKKPALALVAGKDIAGRFGHLTGFLGLEPRKAVPLVRRYPNLLLLAPHELGSRTEALAKALRLSREAAIIAVRRQPNILSFSTSVLVGHCAAVARVTGASLPKVATAFIRNPAILQVKPETIGANIEETARLIGCNGAEIATSFLTKPPLLTMRPSFVVEKLHDLARIFEMSRKQMTERVLAYPYLLSFATENTAGKLGLLVKLSEAVEKPATAAEILAMVPMAFSYSKERIAMRVEMARAGIGPRSVGGLLSMPDEKVAKLLGQRPDSIDT